MSGGSRCSWKRKVPAWHRLGLRAAGGDQQGTAPWGVSWVPCPMENSEEKEEPCIWALIDFGLNLTSDLY